MKRGVRILLVIGAVGFGILFVQTLVQFIGIKMKNDRIATEIETLKMENDQLRFRLKTLYNDANYVEEIARQQIGLVKDNETVYIIAGENKYGVYK